MNCPICLERAGDTMTSLSCGHLFCDKCVQEAHQGDRLIWRSCPMCRRAINNDSIHSCTRKVFIDMSEPAGHGTANDSEQLRAKIASLEARLLQDECRARQAEVNDARCQHLEACVVTLQRNLNEETRTRQDLQSQCDRIRIEEKNARAAEIQTIQYNHNATLQELRGKKAEVSLLLSERDRKDRELHAYLQALRESNSRLDAANQECQALRRDVETQRTRIERLETELKAEKDIHNLRGNHLSQILNDNPRTSTPTQCATPSHTPPRPAVAQVHPFSVKIEPLDLTPTTIRTTLPIKTERTVQEFSVQSRQVVAAEGQRGRVYKPVACVPVAPKHDVTDEQTMKLLAPRPLPVPAPKVAIPVEFKLPSPAPSPQKSAPKRNAHVKWTGYGCPQFTDVPECDGPSGVHCFSGSGSNQYKRRFTCNSCGWWCSEKRR